MLFLLTLCECPKVFFPLLGKMAVLISGIKSLMLLPWYRASLRSVRALRHQNTGKAAYKTCSGSLCGRGRGKGLCYPAFMQSFAPLVSITRQICLCPLSCPSPLFAGKTRGSTWNCFLWCWDAKSTFLQRLQTQWPSPELWGRGRELGSEHGRPLPVPGERPCSRAVPALLSARSTTPCEHLGKPSVLAATAPPKCYNRKDKIISFCFLLSQGDFLALLQLYPPRNTGGF